jgi:hypothetical protein
MPGGTWEWTRLENEFGTALAWAGYDALGYSTTFLNAADAQELIVDTVNTPWVLSVDTNRLKARVTMDVGAETVTVFHNLPVKQNQGNCAAGLKLASFSVFYTVGTADLTSATFTLLKETLPTATGTAPTGASVALTGTELLTQDDHLVTMTVDTPEVLDGDTENYTLQLAFEMANTGTLDYWGTQLKYTIA